MVYLSIVIPSYNAQNTIMQLLDSVKRSAGIKSSEIEIFIVDDKSKDQTIETVEKYYFKNKKSLPDVKICALSANCGPAMARNIGVKYSKGKIVLFLDSDVILFRNTLSEIIESFKNDPDLFALTGVWDKKQKSHDFFPKFKALRDWSYWINERNPRDYYYLFSTRIAAIDRGLFLRLGGFDTSYKAALVEDIELTYRIARRHAVIFNPKVKVSHEFEDFLTVAKKYFWRSYFWSQIYSKRKKFDPVATTRKEAITTISAAVLVVLGILIILSYLSNLGYLNKLTRWLLPGFVLAVLIHLWGVRKFLWFTLKEEGLIFTIRSFFTGISLYVVILFGAAVSLLGWKLKR